MLLAHAFAEPELNLTLGIFLRAAREILVDRFASVLLYGSILFDDLAPGYGDLDFLVVVEGEWRRTHAAGAWRELLSHASEVRRDPRLAEEPDTQAWLAGLTGLIRDAYRELEDAL